MNAFSLLVEEYVARTQASHGMHERFRGSLPGGETRSVTHYDPYPVVLAYGEAALVYDLDGQQYLDVLNNYTALVHGHAFPPVIEAVEAVLPRGTVFPAPHISQLELAELLTSRYPGVDMVRFTNSGTEAALLALRIARAATGRRRLVLFEGGYHGTAPEFSDVDPEVVRVRFNDTTAAEHAISETTAAVFVEPFLGSGGVLPATVEFLRTVQAKANAVGALFVLDEVQSLRNAFGGVHGALSLTPDLILMGKIIGGGFPVGAVGGSARLMELTAASCGGRLAHSGTFNGNVISMTAGIASLRNLDKAAIMRLNERAASVADQIEDVGKAAHVPVTVTRSGSILHVHLTKDRPAHAAETARTPASWRAALHLLLLLEGVYAAPRGMLNLSTVLDDGQLGFLVESYAGAFVRLREIIELTSAAANVPG